MQAQVAPIRDAIIAGQFSAMFALVKASRRAAAQNNPLRATGPCLDDIGGERGIYRQVGEPDDPPNAVLYGPPAVAYRQRINAEPNVVDPNDVIAAANNVLAPYTTISCRYAEQSDGWFIDDGSSTAYSSHVFQELPTPLVPVLPPTSNVQTVPNYPDRLYPSATPAGLLSIPNRRPPGAMLNGDSYARWFLLRVPDISQVDTDIAAVFDGTQDAVNVGLFSVGASAAQEGVSPPVWLTDVNPTFLFSFTSTVDQIYASLVAAVEAIRMHSMRWSCIVDPLLTA